MNDCIFCLISKGEVNSKKLFSNDFCFVIEDIAPKAPLHLLIIPHKHILRLSDFEDVAIILGSMFDAAVNYAKNIGIADVWLHDTKETMKLQIIFLFAQLSFISGTG